jgi:hypothetical protein
LSRFGTDVWSLEWLLVQTPLLSAASRSLVDAVAGCEHVLSRISEVDDGPALPQAEQMVSLLAAIETIRAVQSHCADSLSLLLEVVGERGGEDGLMSLDT